MSSISDFVRTNESLLCHVFDNFDTTKYYGDINVGLITTNLYFNDNLSCIKNTVSLMENPNSIIHISAKFIMIHRLIHNIGNKSLTNNLCITGGAFASILKDKKDNADIDIFPYGFNSIEEVNKRFEKLVSDLKTMPDVHIQLFVKYKNYVNIYIKFLSEIITIQYIFDSRYKTKEDVVKSFDFGICGIYFDNGKLLIKNPIDLILNSFECDMTKHGYDLVEGYAIRRILKYLNKGYNLKLNQYTKVQNNKLMIYVGERIYGYITRFEGKFYACDSDGEIIPNVKMADIIDVVINNNIKDNIIHFDLNILKKYIDDNPFYYSNFSIPIQLMWYPSYGRTLEELKSFNRFEDLNFESKTKKTLLENMKRYNLSFTEQEIKTLQPPVPVSDNKKESDKSEDTKPEKDSKNSDTSLDGGYLDTYIDIINSRDGNLETYEEKYGKLKKENEELNEKFRLVNDNYLSVCGNCKIIGKENETLKKENDEFRNKIVELKKEIVELKKYKTQFEEIKKVLTN